MGASSGDRRDVRCTSVPHLSSNLHEVLTTTTKGERATFDVDGALCIFLLVSTYLKKWASRRKHAVAYGELGRHNTCVTRSLSIRPSRQGLFYIILFLCIFLTKNCIVLCSRTLRGP